MMNTIADRHTLRSAIKQYRQQGRSIGFVPTMGFLHAGHLSLIERAKQENDVVVASIFVNPTQFGPNEDFDAYPRALDTDSRMLAEKGVDLLYAPGADTLYPPGYATYVETAGSLTEGLCGASRPGHFRGVTTIVTKLFHLVSPDRAYFGQKDAQQVAVIQRMVADLDFDVRIVVCPTVREADGLAMSSRNSMLSAAQRSEAVKISKALSEAAELIAQGKRQAETIRRHVTDKLNTIAGGRIDYVAVVDARSLAAIDAIAGEVLIAVAVKLGPTRLIDNIRLEV